MTFLKWLFCPHDWKEKDKIYLWDSSAPESEKPARIDYIYQCSKCTRFKIIRMGA